MPAKPGSIGRSLAKILAVSAALVTLAVLAFLAVFAYETAAPAEPAKPGLFTVEKGENLSSVAQRLEEDGRIRSALAFKLLARAEAVDSKLKAGTYRIEARIGSGKVLDILVSGKQALVRFTLPEGYTLSQAAQLLQREGVAPAVDFLNAARSPALAADLGIPALTMEGYLFPDTYFFPLAFGGEKAVRAMVAAFRTRLASYPETLSLSPAELHQKLILASIIEREYRLPEEASLIASVFLNRLKIGMALQSCATVVYVITEKLGKPHPDVIYDRDLKLSDPYNTYAQRGLPPGPISNPGLTAIEASLRPRRSDYLYFRLTDADEGRHHFSRTLEEHLGARAQAVKRVGG